MHKHNAAMAALRARYEQASTSRKRRIVLASIVLTLVSVGAAAKLIHDAGEPSAATSPASITTITGVTVPGTTVTNAAPAPSK